MNIPLLDKRVKSLEEMMADLIATVSETSFSVKELGKKIDRHIEDNERDRTAREIEMRKFKEEMQEDRRSFREESREERRSSKEEMSKFREEMQEDRRSSKEGMDKFIEEMRLDRRELNKKLGDIAHKQGRMAEDLVAPSICRILREVLGVPESTECNQTERSKRRHTEITGRMKEFDVVADCGDFVMVSETKSSVEANDVTALLKTIQEFRKYFPEHKDKKVIGCLATLYADKSLIKYASRKGILVLAVGDELMDIMNEPGFKPAIF